MKPSRLLTGLAILTASLVTSVASPAELRYRIQPIESGDPALFVLIADLNNLGEAAGLTFDSAGNQLTDLGVPAGFDSTTGRSVNNFNRVAGAAMLNFASTAATWQNGTWTLLPSVVPGVEQVSDAASINDLGVAVGVTSLATQSRTLATLWWKGRAFRVDDLVSADDPLNHSSSSRAQISSTIAATSSYWERTRAIRPAPGRTSCDSSRSSNICNARGGVQL